MWFLLGMLIFFSDSFFRTYKPDGNGTFDQNVVANVNNAIKGNYNKENEFNGRCSWHFH